MVDTKSDTADGDSGPPKTAKQLEKEAKKLAKLEKFKQKQDKKETNAAAVTAKPKDKPEVCLDTRHFERHDCWAQKKILLSSICFVERIRKCIDCFGSSLSC